MAARRLNSRGFPVGESRKNCTIPDAVVVRIRDMREHQQLSLLAISQAVRVPVNTVKSICLYRRRMYVYEEEGQKEGEQDQDRSEG